MKRLGILLCLLLGDSVMAAIAATTVWECRATGAVDNGGGFDSAVAGGADHSQADAAVLARDDLYFTSGTTLISTLGGFDADMVGNVIYIHAGTHFTVGWYEIMTRVSTNEVTLDRAPASEDTTAHKDAHGKVGGGIALGNSAIDNELFAAAAGNGIVAGNTVYVAGAWTVSESIAASGNDGTNIAPITVIGYVTSRATTPTLANRPAWTCAASSWTSGDFWVFKNIIITGTSSTGFTVGANCVVHNCKVSNTSGTASRTALGPGGYTIITECECNSTLGTAIVPSGNGVRVTQTTIHDSATGYSLAAYGIAKGCAVYNCTTGLTVSTVAAPSIIDCSIVNCESGITGNTASCLIENTIIDDSDTAELNWTTNYLGWYHHNCWGEASPTLTNTSLALGPGNLSADPALTNAAGADFTLGAASVAIDAGSQVGVNEALVGDYKQNIGVDGAASGAGAIVIEAKNGGKQ